MEQKIEVDTSIAFVQSIYHGNKDENYSFLYQLLVEREPHESISHNDMPTWKQHEEFLSRSPYKGWYLIWKDPLTPVGSVYITFTNEIGVHIAKKYRGQGFGTLGIAKIMEMHKEQFFLANINPANTKSIDLFQKYGFKHIQNTYKLERKKDDLS